VAQIGPLGDAVDVVLLLCDPCQGSTAGVVAAGLAQGDGLVGGIGQTGMAGQDQELDRSLAQAVAGDCGSGNCGTWAFESKEGRRPFIEALKGSDPCRQCPEMAASSRYPDQSLL